MRASSPITALQDVFWQRAAQLLLYHTNPWDLDAALEGFGYGIGPCAAQDHLGLDKVLARASKDAHLILSRMLAEGRMGKTGGVGYYRYPGGGGAVIDPLIEDLIREEAWFAKIERQEQEDDWLVAQMNAALVAGCRALPMQSDWPKVLGRAVHFPGSRVAALGL